MQMQVKSNSLRRFDLRRGIFRGWGLGAIFFLLFLFMPQFFASLLADSTVSIFPTLDGDQWLGILTSAGIFILMALGLNVVVGFAGLLDLGYAAFFAIGAYAYGVVNFGDTHIPVWPLLLAAPVVAGLFGVMLGAPTLRLRGDYLAIVTLGFGEIVPIVFRNIDRTTLPFLGSVEIGGVNGLGVRSPTPLSFPFGNYTFELATAAHDDVTHFYYLVFGLVVLATIGVVLLRTSKIGRAWIAIREDETAAACSGINLVATKLTAFAIGASVSGFAGVLYGAQNHIVSPEEFGFTVSITVLVMIVLGGMGSIPGVITGALLLSIVNRLLAIVPTAIQLPSSALHFLEAKAPNLAEQINDSEFLIFGGILLLMIILRPQGLIPSALRKRELKGEAVAAVTETGEELVVPVGAPDDATTIESFQELEAFESEIEPEDSASGTRAPLPPGQGRAGGGGAQ
ncbi:MAG TPA: branched-chain amino acid ABC transporter permease [Ktedonobacterales bacterium]